MADYYTKFSFIVELGEEAANEALAIQSAAMQWDESTPDGIPQQIMQELADEGMEEASSLCAIDIEKQGEKHYLWFNSYEGDIMVAAIIVKYLLGKYCPGGRVVFHWSNDCSKPRTDAYGGGVCVVTAKNIYTKNTIECELELLALAEKEQL